MLQFPTDTCGMSLVACQNSAMRSLRILSASLLVAMAVAGCSRAPPQATPAPIAWLGTPVVAVTPAMPGSRFPNLASSPSNTTIVMSWLEPRGGRGEFALRYAQWDRDGRWSEPVEVASGKDWFVNWADFPSVVPTDAGTWAAHWLQQKPGGVYSYDVMVRLSADSGRTWGPPRTPHDDGTPTEHGFVSLTQWDDQPYAIWLDGRQTTGEGHAHDADGHGASGAMTLRGAALPLGGDILDRTEIDARVCDCCQTDVATTADGLVVVYRDRSDDEVRDIRAARLVKGAWTESVVVHADGWRIAACPVNGPAIAALGDSVVVAWFTAPDRPRVRLAFSDDGGRTFAAPIEVASDRVVGRVDLVLLADGRAVVSWLADGDHGAVIRARPFTRSGPAGPAADVATASIARSSGFPQMAPVSNGLLFAWTVTGATVDIQTVFAPLN
jgi:hypothetical protein